MTATELENLIRSEIPVLRNLPFQISEVSPLEVRVRAQLKDHLNHKGTAFGGSLYQTALVASYGLFLNLMETANLSTRDFVIAEGKIKYRSAVESDFEAVVKVEQQQADEFVQQLKSTGKADLNLSASLNANGRERARLDSRFVAFRDARSHN